MIDEVLIVIVASARIAKLNCRWNIALSISLPLQSENTTWSRNLEKRGKNIEINNSIFIISCLEGEPQIWSYIGYHHFDPIRVQRVDEISLRPPRSNIPPQIHQCELFTSNCSIFIFKGILITNIIQALSLFSQNCIITLSYLSPCLKYYNYYSKTIN